MQISYVSLTNLSAQNMESFFQEHWGSTQMVTRGKVHNLSQLLGFVAMLEGKIVGVVTYHICGDECEIVSLDSLLERKGIGTTLLTMIESEARLLRCQRVWLITTNDNTDALRFYQQRRFTLVTIYRNALTLSRQFKPQIPQTGNFGIPICHEIELEFQL